MEENPAVIVLAAGKGSRFEGSTHKLAQRLGDSSVLAETLAHALASRLPVIVVTTEAFSDVARSSVAARDVVVLPEVGTGAAPLGMGVSIAAGVSARPHAAGWLVLPGDMPLVRSSTLQAVARGLEHHSVVYAQHRGRRGHPVGFAAEFYSELVALRGDEGARRLLARYPAFGIELDDPGILVDIDTPGDLEAVRRDIAA
ncbi:MAG TPA: nucleotidyltransferase family protein [Caldimonas sp.]|jgi:molybdenum cofactor cytidylyltransferase|nr:nucleotidyltransferase family protein [Caldimonas sp.]HEX2540305.1 nucleotidyltransferase family protein [Caldimonas sp.]